MALLSNYLMSSSVHVGRCLQTMKRASEPLVDGFTIEDLKILKSDKNTMR